LTLALVSFTGTLLTLNKLNMVVKLCEHTIDLLKKSDLSIELACCELPLEDVEGGCQLLCIHDLLQQIVTVNRLHVALISVQDKNVEFLVRQWELKNLKDASEVVVSDESILLPVDLEDILDRQVIFLDVCRDAAEQLLIVSQRIGVFLRH